MIGRCAAILLAGVLALAVAPFASAQDLLVFAAASLKNALDEADEAWRRDHGGVVVSYAASSALAKQIAAGAPADVFISADLDWMDYLAQRKLIRPETRADLLRNAIVLIAPASAEPPAGEALGSRILAGLGAAGRLAMADPAAVPAGKYGKAALQALGIWDQLAARVAPAENVRAALRLVSRGEAPLGIVYRTDAAEEPEVKIVASFPPASHPPIIYPIAVTAASKNAAAAAYVAWLRSPAARPIFARHGFVPVE
jgi:molybdate transport system substrate-binding protein